MFRFASPPHPLDELTRAILRAAVEPQRWQEVVDGLHRSSGGVQFDLVCATPEGNAYALFDGGGDPAYIQSYGTYYHRINPWAKRWASAPPGIVFTSPEILRRAELVRTEFYADWARLQENLVGGAGVILSSRAGHTFMLGATVRERRVDDDEATCSRLLQQLLPVLRGAVEISSVLAVRELDVLGARGRADSEAALFALGPGGGVLAANEPGVAMLTGARGAVRDRPDGRLRLADARADEALQAALSPGARGLPRSVSLRLGAAWGSCHVHAIPLEPASAARLSVGWFGERCLASHLLIVAPPGRAASTERRLVQALGVTPAEATVVAGIAEGRSPAEIARDRSLSIHTVRNQLKSAMAKAGVRRQAELVRTVGDLVP